MPNKLTNNKFIIKKTYEGRKIPIYYVKNSKKSKDVQAKLLFNLRETSVTCRNVENGCKIVVFDSR